MSFINFQDLDAQVNNQFGPLNESLTNAIENDFRKETHLFSVHAEYDIFLSHRYLDAPRVRALKDKLEVDYGLSVYIDWIADAELVPILEKIWPVLQLN